MWQCNSNSKNLKCLFSIQNYIFWSFIELFWNVWSSDLKQIRHSTTQVSFPACFTGGIGCLPLLFPVGIFSVFLISLHKNSDVPLVIQKWLRNSHSVYAGMQEQLLKILNSIQITSHNTADGTINIILSSSSKLLFSTTKSSDSLLTTNYKAYVCCFNRESRLILNFAWHSPDWVNKKGTPGYLRNITFIIVQQSHHLIFFIPMVWHPQFPCCWSWNVKSVLAKRHNLLHNFCFLHINGEKMAMA